MANIAFVNVDAEALWAGMLEVYFANGGEPLWPGDEKEMLLRGVQAIIVSERGMINAAGRMRLLRYATGLYLDALGENRGIERLPAVPATATVEMTLLTGGAPYNLPKGTRLTYEGELFFELEEQQIGLGEQGVTKCIARVRGTAGGASHNGLPVGTRLTAVDTVPYFVSAVLAAQSTGGADTEADDSFRERIRLGAAGYSVAGPKRAYEYLAMAVSVQVKDAEATSPTPGTVLVTLLMDRGMSADAKAELMAKVLAALSAEDVRPLTDTVEVAEAETVTFEVVLQYDAPPNQEAAVKTALEDAAQDYLAWQEAEIGRGIDPGQLLFRAYQCGAMRVTEGPQSHIAGGPWRYTNLGQNQVARGSVRLEAL